MKSPEEIKKGLECCTPKWDGKSIVPKCDECPYIHEGHWCRNNLFGELRRYISDIEQRLSQAERERDAAVRDIANYAHSGNICKHCHNDCKHSDLGCPLWPSDCEDYEWRGVCEENSKEEQQ